MIERDYTVYGLLALVLSQTAENSIAVIGFAILSMCGLAIGLFQK